MGSYADMSGWSSAERTVLDRTRPAPPDQDEYVQVGPPVGGGQQQASWVWAVVVGFNLAYTRLMCLLVGNNGVVDLSATPFEVRIFAASDHGFVVDPPLEQCSPLFLYWWGTTPPDAYKVKVEYRGEDHHAGLPVSKIEPGYWLAQDVWLTCYIGS